MINIRIQKITAQIAASAPKCESSVIIGHISQYYHDNYNRDFNAMRAYIINIVYSQKNTKYAIETNIHEIKIINDRAYMDISGSAIFESQSKRYDERFEVIFKKEPYRHMFIIPSYRWKIITVN